MSTLHLECVLTAAANALGSSANRLHKLAHDLWQRRMTARNAINPNALLVWIPKTAGTSLNSLLAQAGGQTFLTIDEARRYFRNRGIVTFGHISLPHLREAGVINDSFCASALKFAFVRNPFDRAVSLYEYSRRIGKLPPMTSFSMFCRILKDRAYEDIGDYNHLGLSQLNPQTRWLTDRSGDLCVDFIGRFEDFSNDVERLLRRLNLPIRAGGIPHVNQSPREPTENYYGDAEVDAVQTAYRCDFEAFGYSIMPRWETQQAPIAA